MKKKKLNRIKFVDESCEIGERVRWENLRGDYFEGNLIDWDNNTAIIELDNGEIKAVAC